MVELSDSDLLEIGRKAAAQVDDLGVVERVEVTMTFDSADQPAYFFRFLIEEGRDPNRTGLPRIRLVQKLREELDAHDDHHYPIVQVLNRAEWAGLVGA
jgi:hypothetical protein